MINFKAKVYTVNKWIIVKLPQAARLQLPSRGQVMVKGTLNGAAFQTALEPDGDGGHWLAVDNGLQQAANVRVGDTVTLAIESTKDWPEPAIPLDIRAALDVSPDIQKLWRDITPMARWEWIRWIGSTAQSETRQRRIEVSISKLTNGSRRPCCFNRNMCCVPAVSKNGILVGPN